MYCTMSWNSPRSGYRPTRAWASTCIPSSGAKESVRLCMRNIAHRTWQFSSLSVKYMWPERGRARLETSPSIHTVENASSRIARASRFRRETV